MDRENVTMSRGDVYLSKKESRRVYVMERLLEGVVTVKDASCVLGLSERQIKRLKAGVKERGIAALAHGNRGRKPKHATPKEVKEAIVGFAVGKYSGASYQHMSELMKEHDGIFVSAKTVGRILKEASIPNKHTHKSPRRRRARNRMPMEGMLVQCNASPHDWFEGKSSKLCLHGAIDDATGKVLGLYFRPNEDLLGYLHVLKQMVEDYGVPRSIYSDGHSIFFSPKGDKLTIEEELKGERVKLTQFGEVLNQLSITHIKARSPQAKGRIERLWGTLQSRLIVELRIANISSMDEEYGRSQ
nr:ISNCY family transposase [Thermovirga lienii]